MADGMIGDLEDEAPDLTQHIVCFRAWSIRGGVLVSPYKEHKWVKGPNQAMCLVPGAKQHLDTPVVQGDCHCGFYGYYNLTGRRGLLSGTIRDSVNGAVKCWGRVAVHATGVRCQHAEIICLLEPHEYAAAGPPGGGRAAYLAAKRSHRKRIEHTAELYGVPVVPRSRIDLFIEDFGTPVPNSILKRVEAMNKKHGPEWHERYQ